MGGKCVSFSSSFSVSPFSKRKHKKKKRCTNRTQASLSHIVSLPSHNLTGCCVEHINFPYFFPLPLSRIGNESDGFTVLQRQCISFAIKLRITCDDNKWGNKRSLEQIGCSSFCFDWREKRMVQHFTWFFHGLFFLTCLDVKRISLKYTNRKIDASLWKLPLTGQ